MRHDPDALMIFAAGHGTRMRDLTRDRPKPLVPLLGRPLIEHALDQARALPLRRIVVNTHAHADQMTAHFAARPEITLSPEDELLDTGGGLRAALPLLGAGPVMTLNSDAAWAGPNALATLCKHWEPAVMSALLLLVTAENATGHAGSGSYAMDPDRRLTQPGALIYTGAQILDPAVLERVPERIFSLKALWDRLEAEGRLFGCIYPGRWADVGTPEGLAAASRMLETHDV